MHIVVLRETAPGERRVALVPDGVKKLVAAGHTIAVERGAGDSAHAGDAAYEAAGARMAAGAAEALAGADVVVGVRAPAADRAALVPGGALVVSLFQPARETEVVERWRDRAVTSVSLERIPRITRAQSMDVLSSQATVAGYKAALIGASALERILPMLTTAAGTLTPARALVIGAGVAGLQAIATLRRLGAVVSGFDIRPAAQEQIRSLGATALAIDTASAAAEGAGGYARAQDQSETQRTADALAPHIQSQDLVVCTAQVPGRPAPRLISAETVEGMRPGAVIVDIAAENGGNCAATRPGESVVVAGVTIVGPLDLPSAVPVHASQMFSTNVVALLQHLAVDGTLRLDLDDEITGAIVVTHAGALRTPESTAAATPPPAPPPTPT